MAVQVLARRSSVLHDRPYPIRLGSAELAVNNNASDPGLFFADNTASPSTGLVKIGPISIGSTAPNTSATGYTSNSKGESWLDTSSTHIQKIFDGSTWQLPKAVASIYTGYPSNPTDGQLHYNESNNALYIYDLGTTAWKSISSAGGSFTVDETGKTDGSIVYYDAGNASFKANATTTKLSLVDGGNF